MLKQRSRLFGWETELKDDSMEISLFSFNQIDLPPKRHETVAQYV